MKKLKKLLILLLYLLGVVQCIGCAKSSNDKNKEEIGQMQELTTKPDDVIVVTPNSSYDDKEKEPIQNDNLSKLPETGADKTDENGETEKFRVVISTDFPPLDIQYPFPENTPNDHKSDPDDLQSMVRFLLYANEFDVEGLIASAATFAGVANKQNIIDIIELYGESYDKLAEFDSDYPTAGQLIDVTYQGNHQTWGKSVEHNIGEGKDSEASDAIIRIVDKEDSRPVWFCVWGDCSNIAQAVYRVKQSRSQEELEKFISKMRIYQVAHQDDTIDWLMENFPSLFIIYAKDTYMGMFDADNAEWVEKNVRTNHGSLGAVYPKRGMGCEGVCEGDTPSFLYLLSATFGHSDAEDPTRPSWGGQFKRVEGTNHYVDYSGRTSISMHTSEIQKDFETRLKLIEEIIEGKEDVPEKSDESSKKQSAVYEKSRVINITDLIADPDDEQSLVRMFVTSNMVDLEGIIVSTSCWRKNQNQEGMNKLKRIVKAYGEVLPNLEVHADGYPALDYIESICVMGQTGYSMGDVGEGKDTDGSELIIKAVDKEDERPVWINLWGGANTVAQALWKVEQTRTEEEINKFVKKLRIYDVLGQDEAGAWIVTQFPEIIYIRSTEVYGFGGSDAQKNDAWRTNNIISHGVLGKLYPLRTYGAFEGDSPSFMYQIPTGMNDPEMLGCGSFGGRFSTEKKANIKGMSAVTGEGAYETYYMYGDCPEKNSSISCWATAYQNDFAARMDWTINDTYAAANHHPIAVLNGDTTTSILTKKVTAGTEIELSAVGSFDPDNDELSYRWNCYKEAGTYSHNVAIENKGTDTACVKIPTDAAGSNIHIILEVHDNGEPNLYAYRRIVLEVIENSVNE